MAMLFNLQAKFVVLSLGPLRSWHFVNLCFLHLTSLNSNKSFESVWPTLLCLSARRSSCVTNRIPIYFPLKNHQESSDVWNVGLFQTHSISALLKECLLETPTALLRHM